VKVQFEFSAADLADVGKRTMDRSPLVRKWRLQAGGLWALLGGFVTFVVVPGATEVRVAAALLVTLALFIAAARRARSRKANPRVLEFWRERLGGDGPFVCEVEITEDGVSGRQLGTETRRRWSQVASVSEVSGGIEFVFRPVGSLLVRDRAFTDAKARAEFLALARGFVQTKA
jgi:hypothetical protein